MIVWVNKNKIHNELTESMCDLASCEPWRLHLNAAEMSLVFKRATLVGGPFQDTRTLAGSSEGLCWGASAWAASRPCWTEPSPGSQLVCVRLQGGLGAHYCQFQPRAGHALAVRLWENVPSCFIIFCTGPFPKLAFGPRRGVGAEQ